jgi:hypothetical protein
MTRVPFRSIVTEKQGIIAVKVNTLAGTGLQQLLTGGAMTCSAWEGSLRKPQTYSSSCEELEWEHDRTEMSWRWSWGQRPLLIDVPAVESVPDVAWWVHADSSRKNEDRLLVDGCTHYFRSLLKKEKEQILNGTSVFQAFLWKWRSIWAAGLLL